MRQIILVSSFIMIFLFSNVAFAQDFDDIGSLIFRDLLQMSDYPGAPFTGAIIQDLIMFLLVPTVFIILLVYMLLGRLFWPTGEQAKLRLLVGVTMYLFIVAGGYYSTFARLAGPYFLFLIFIFGLLYFFLGHFSIREGGGYGRGRGGGYSSGESGRSKYAHLETMNRMELNIEKDRIQADLNAVRKQLKDATRKGSTETHLENLRTREADLAGELREIQTLLNVVKRQSRKFGFS